MTCYKYADYVIKINSTKSATCFQLSGFKSNDFEPSDLYPRYLA